MTYEAIRSGDAELIDTVMDEHLYWLESFWERETGRPRLRRTPEFLLPKVVRGDGASDRLLAATAVEPDNPR
jgi:hypothetical protein